MQFDDFINANIKSIDKQKMNFQLAAFLDEK